MSKHYDKIRKYIYLLNGKNDEAIRYENPLADPVRMYFGYENKYYIFLFPYHPYDETEKVEGIPSKRLDFVSASATMGRVTILISDGLTIRNAISVQLNNEGRFEYASEYDELKANQTFGKGISPLGIIRHTEKMLKWILEDYGKEITEVTK